MSRELASKPRLRGARPATNCLSLDSLYETDEDEAGEGSVVRGSTFFIIGGNEIRGCEGSMAVSARPSC
jgi:hypothetical protein